MWQSILVLCTSIAMNAPLAADTELVRLKVGTELVVNLDRDSFEESVGIRGV